MILLKIGHIGGVDIIEGQSNKGIDYVLYDENTSIMNLTEQTDFHDGCLRESISRHLQRYGSYLLLSPGVSLH